METPDLLRALTVVGGSLPGHCPLEAVEGEREGAQARDGEWENGAGASQVSEQARGRRQEEQK